MDKYVYEICPYGSAAQKEGHSRTSLGNWQGFKDNYSIMSFTGGQHCWNGPLRSMQVRLLAVRSRQLAMGLICNVHCRCSGFRNCAYCLLLMLFMSTSLTIHRCSISAYAHCSYCQEEKAD